MKALKLLLVFPTCRQEGILKIGRNRRRSGLSGRWRVERLRSGFWP